MKGLICAIFAVLGTAVTAPGADWSEDLDQALEVAASSGKYVLVDFSGSDWCGWCKKLDAEVFKQDAFRTFAESNLVTVLIDFPRSKPQPAKRKKANGLLAEKYGISGFPTILLLSPSGDLVGRTGYKPGGAEPYVEHILSLINKHKGGGSTKTD